MDEQELFDKVATHLLKQGRKSEDDMQCRYRSPDGLMCAVGVCIPNHCYTPEMEGAGLWFYSTPEILRQATSKKGVALCAAFDCAGLMDGGVYELLKDLQQVHDQRDPCAWAEALREIANDRALRFTADVSADSPDTPPQ